MKPVITVDFDNCLAFESVTNTGWICIGTGVLKPIEPVIAYVKRKYAKGFELHIVSFRKEEDKQEMITFCKEQKIPIESFTCTDSKSKTPFLKALNSTLHIDDSLSVCMGAKMEGINVLFVDCGQLFDESQKEMARSLDSIKVELD
jgi:3'-phosphoadenosine 5'-phosphosulfate sulfotransferase (PAPS reductase)/FAD synthetase